MTIQGHVSGRNVGGTVAPRERSFKMPLLQLFIVAVVAMIALASLRVARVHLGRTPLPEERGRRLFFLAFVLVPPIALALIQPNEPPGPLRGLLWAPAYGLMLAGLVVVMWAAAVVVRIFVRGPSRLLLLDALVGGGKQDQIELRLNAPVTAKLTDDVARVDRANAVFPRGGEFPAQIDRDGFRFAWDALDAATATLERQIADDQRLGLGVARVATATASDARSRLDTLRSLAFDGGQAWAAA
jgi:hypothetical protein